MLESRRHPERFAPSYAQERLWFLDQFAPGVPAYNVPAAHRLRGPIQLGPLEGALNDLIRRHEVLRTTFPYVDDRPVQEIQEYSPRPLPVIDLRGYSPEQREVHASGILAAEAGSPFDLAHGPVFRFGAILMSDYEVVLALTLHHIVSDGVSMSILHRELGEFYEARVHGRPPRLPELSIQYADYAQWQREQLTGEPLQRLLDYWCDQLDGAPPMIELPTNWARPPVQTFEGAFQGFYLPERAADGFRSLAREEHATLFMVTLAALNALLSRCARTSDVVVGTPISTRSRPDLESLIGLFVNTLVLRTDCSGNPTFRELVRRVREMTLEAYEHQDLPFERLVEELQPERHLSHNPLFQVMFVFQNGSSQGEAVVSPPPSRLPEPVPSTPKFDLTFTVVDSPGALRAGFEYRTDLFDPHTIRRMASHLETLVLGIAADPDRPIDSLPLLEGAERAWVLQQSKGLGTGTRDGCMHQLVSEAARRTPEAEAVRAQGRSLTYRELDERSNRLANFLLSRAAGRDTRIGVCMERSLDLVVALLGVLKAGAAYVPLDPEYPTERLAYMLKDAQVPVLLTQQAVESRLPEHGAATVCLDADWEDVATASAEDPQVPLSPDDLAYVIYTSGSTGRPKGAMISHRALVNHMCWLQQRFPLSSADRVLQKTPFSFDVSILEFFWPLFTGARLVMARPGRHTDPDYLFETVLEEEITVIYFVASGLRVFLDSAPAERCRSLRHVFCGGEAMPRTLPRQLFERLPTACLHNIYGPTEAAIDITWWTCSPDDHGRAVPIGRPIDNSQVLVLDEHARPVPIGVVGELHVGGPNLARGYLRRPALTAESFVPHPDPSGPGERLYRTGDLGRLRTDGAIEFLGRLDHQVKIRGHRIELGEIEAVLQEHSGIEECVVVTDEQDAARLLAYVVLHPGATVSDVKAHCRTRLPEYMVPSLFVRLDEIPRSAAGKLERRRLPSPNSQIDEVDRLQPQSELEARLVRIWRDVLDLAQIGVDESFFELGGHSLLATQIVARIREDFEVDLPLRAIFEAPTISGLAEELARKYPDQLAALTTGGPSASEAGGTSRRPASPDRRQSPPSYHPLSHGQTRLWFLDRLEPGSAMYNVTFTSRLHVPLEPAVLDQALTAIQVRHESLRSTFTLRDGTPMRVRHSELRASLEVHDLRSLPKEQREGQVLHLTRAKAAASFDLEAGPLLRCCLYTLEDASHVLLLVLHHLLSDEWSMGVFSRELWSLYDAFRQGRPSPLPELGVQYSDFTAWEQDYLSGPRLQRLLAYWEEKLKGAPPLLELPTDRPRPAVQTSNGATLDIHVPSPVVDSLKELSCQAEGTLFMTLLGALDVFLCHESGQYDISVGSPIANRTQPRFEALIGFFVNTLVLRVDLSGDPSFLEVLQRVREEALDAYEHQALPFGMLVERLQPTRSLSHNPLFQVMFVFQNTPGASTGGVEDGVLLDNGTAKFDLLVSLHESDDGLRGFFEYNTDLFDAASVERMVVRYTDLLERIAGAPQRRISQLRSDPAEDSHRLRVWNDTAVCFPVSEPLHRRFSAQARRTPEAIAVRDGGEFFTYEQLEQRADRLASTLREKGLRRGCRAAICAEPGFELYASILAVLKTGSACVPLDSSDARQRMEFIAGDAGASVLLVGSGLRGELPGFQGSVITLDGVAEPPAASASQAHEDQGELDDLAYVIYTSGSTGRPKGVAMPHRVLDNLVSWQVERSVLEPEAATLQLAPLSFDVSFQEMFSTWCAGGSLVAADAALRHDPVALLEYLDSMHVRRLFLPYVALQQLAVAAAGHRAPESLTEVITAGEQLRITPEIRALFERLPGARLYNQYGPSETHVVTEHALAGPASDWPVLPLVGRPISNTKIYVLDEHLQPLPVNGRGELYVGGTPVSEGYIDRPVQTAKSFVPDPFDGAGTSRLYRTGDLARWTSEGELQFLGRTDEQLKIRGFRVEPGEIEAAILSHQGVSECVVVVRSEADGSRALVAWATGDVQDEQELRDFVSERLPHYMVPSRIALAGSLPLTSSGKLDRSAIASMTLPAPTTSGAHVAPRNTIEATIAEIWSSVLGLEEISVCDDFFALGGHSLLVVRVQAQLLERFGVEVPVRELFEHTTVEEQAKAVVLTQLVEAGEDVDSLLATLEPAPSHAGG